MIAHVPIVYHGGISTCNKNGSCPFLMDTMGGNRVWCKKWMLKGLRGWNIINYMWFRKFAWKKWMHFETCCSQYFSMIWMVGFGVLQRVTGILSWVWERFMNSTPTKDVGKRTCWVIRQESFQSNSEPKWKAPCPRKDLANPGIFGCSVLIWRL